MIEHDQFVPVKSAPIEEAIRDLPPFIDGITQILASWIELPLQKFEIHAFGVDSYDDLLHNQYHDGVPDLIQAISSLNSQFNLAWSIYRIRSGKDVDVGGTDNFGVKHFLHPSLHDEVGSSVIEKLSNMPTIVLFFTHGNLWPPSISIGKPPTPVVGTFEIARELTNLDGRNLMICPIVCYSDKISEPFRESEALGSVFAPNKSSIGDDQASSIARLLGYHLRKIGWTEILGVLEES